MQQGVIAIVLGVALITSWGQLPALHVHAYTDHDHPEHHHGLAAHEHHRAAAPQDDGRLHLESCDPGQHAVSLAMGFAPPPQVQVIHAECASPTVLDPALAVRSVHDLKDVRVHGPPPRAQASPRAPPPHVPA